MFNFRIATLVFAIMCIVAGLVLIRANTPKDCEPPKLALRIGRALVAVGVTTLAAFIFYIASTKKGTMDPEDNPSMGERFLRLPDESLKQIFSHLAPKDLANVQRVHSGLHGVVQEELDSKRVITTQEVLTKIQKRYKPKSGLSVKGFMPDSLAGISSLDLVNTPIGVIGAISFASALKDNTILETLLVRNSRFGDAGAIALAEALKVNKTLKTLDLSDNQIGDASAIALAEALRVNKTLKTLYLWKNYVGDAGAIALAEALRVNKTLEELLIERNRIGENGKQSLDDVLTDDTTLAIYY